jgi:hypothetical protein
MASNAQQTTMPLAGIKITDGGPLMLPEHAVWLRQGRPVWMGSLRQPVEEVDYDEIVLHWTDIARIEEGVWYGQ